MNLVRSGALSGYKALMAEYAVNPVKLILEAGLSDAQFRNPNTYISYIKMATLLELSAAACDAPMFGLILAGRNAPGVLGELPAAVSQEPTIGQALLELNRHIHLVAKGVRIRQLASGENIRLELQFDFDGLFGNRQLLQLSVAHLANIVARLMGRDRFSLALYLRQKFPERGREIEGDSVQCRFLETTSFNAGFDGVMVSAAALAEKPVVDEEALHDHMHERLRELEARHLDSLQNQVRTLITQFLSSGECCVEVVAANLDLHPRMLQLKLKAEQTSYKKLLKETRLAIAEDYLGNSQIPVTDLALNLGFADVAVFSRCFKEWTGYSPRAWRNEFGGQV